MGLEDGNSFEFPVLAGLFRSGGSGWKGMGNQ